VNESYVSRYKGVSRSPIYGPRPWRARIWIAGKNRHLGWSASEEEAGAAYRNAKSRMGRRSQRWICAVGCYDEDRDWVEIELTQGRWAKVDVADLDLVIRQCWHYSAGYAVRNSPTGHIMMYRVILGLAHDDPREPDHRNGDKIDNRRANLRIASRSQNNANHRKQHPNTSSRFKGVSRCRDCARWQAYIHVDNKKLNLGLFPSEEAAALAYNAAATQWFKEFAHLNVL
jgi:HNH endonuclease